MNAMTGLILSSLLFLNTTTEDQDKKGDTKIHGTWTVESFKDSGREENKKGTTCTITKDTITFSREGKKIISIKYTVDTSKNPRWMTLKTKSNKRDTTLPGIYELKGDTLRICYNEGEDRATKFVSERGSSANERLIVMQRKK